MFRFTCTVFLALLQLTLIVADEPMPGKQVEQSLKHGEREVGYLLFLPDDYKAEEKQKPLPLMVFLHGAGERGTDLDLVKKHGPPKIVETKPEFSFIVVSPQCPKGVYWDVDAVMKVIEKVQTDFNVDDSRVYLTGLSMGGYGSWALAAKHPGHFAAVAPICGVGKAETAERLLNVPIWAFHGDADKVVPLSGTTDIVDAIKAKGGASIKQTIYEGVGHDSWTQTYGNPALYEWMLSHKSDPTAISKPTSQPEKTAAITGSLADLKWIAGSWTGEAMGGRFEETWNPVSADSMVGMFKFIKDGKVVFYEILTIVEQDESLLLRLKHFTPDLVGWEEKDKSIEFPLVSISEKEAKFNGLTFTRISDEEMHIAVVMKEEDGEQKLNFVCKRVKR